MLAKSASALDHHIRTQSGVGQAVIEAIIEKITVLGALNAEQETRTLSGIGNVR